MPTILVIDDEPVIHFSVAAAVPDWTVLEAADGVLGLDLVRRHLAEVDLIVLDINMPGMDGYATCLQIRSLSSTIPILPFTGVVEALPFLKELGCLPPLFKGIYPSELRAALHSAIGMTPPPLCPGAAVLAFAQRQAIERERAVRQERMTQPLALFASSPVTCLGLQQLLTAAGVHPILEVRHVSPLRQLLSAMHISILVAPACDWTAVAELVQAYGMPVLFIASTLAEGLFVADLAIGVPLGVVLVDTHATPQALADALSTIAAGERYLARELEAPFAGSPLTSREQTLVALDMQELPKEEIARKLGVDRHTIDQYHTRIYQKLGLSGIKELRRWTEEWLQQRKYV